MTGKPLQPEAVKKRVQALKSQRYNWDNHYQEIAELMMPNKANFTVLRSPGVKKNVQIFDNTAIHSGELLAGALHSMLTNPNQTWFGLTTGEWDLDQRDDVRTFLQDAVKKMHVQLNRSNFQTEVHELYMDIVYFGTPCMSVEETNEDPVLFFSTKDMANVYIEEDNKGRVKGVYRTFMWTAADIVQEFGDKNLPDRVKKSWEKGDDKKFEIVHAVYPKSLLVEYSNFTYVSQYTIVTGKAEDLKVGSFRQNPYLTPRWMKVSGEVYGRSPGMTALPEAKTINQIVKTTIIGAQKTVDPPVQVPDDGFSYPFVSIPGGVNYYRSGTNDRVETIFNDARIDFGFEAANQHRMRIREAFFVDQLQLNDGPQMTATEVMQRTEERMRLLGPMLGRMQSEFLQPLIDRIFDIMLRRGMFGKVPEVLEGRDLIAQYSSVIAQAQKLSEGQGIQRTIEAIAPIVNAQPEVLDNIDGDKLFRIYGDIYGFPQRAMRDNDKIEELREARQQAQQEAAEREKQAQEATNMSQMAAFAQQG